MILYHVINSEKKQQPSSQPASTGQASALVTVQKRVNTAGLRLLSFERHACKVGSWLAFGTLDLGSVSIIS